MAHCVWCQRDLRCQRLVQLPRLHDHSADNNGAAKPHAYNLYAAFDVTSVTEFIDKSEDVVVTRDCAANKAAYVSTGFSLADANNNASYLGVAPRHRTNARHYAATANDTKVYVGGTCLELKTGKQVAP